MVKVPMEVIPWKFHGARRSFHGSHSVESLWKSSHGRHMEVPCLLCIRKCFTAYPLPCALSSSSSSPRTPPRHTNQSPIYHMYASQAQSPAREASGPKKAPQGMPAEAPAARRRGRGGASSDGAGPRRLVYGGAENAQNAGGRRQESERQGIGALREGSRGR